MVFNSPAFVIFAIVFFTVFGFLRGRAKLHFLVLSSFIFYGYWNPKYLILLSFSICFDFLVAYYLDLVRPEWRKPLFLSSMAVNLGILFTFKYCDFFVSTFQDMMSALGMPFYNSGLHLLLPIGISFYTFQSMSYVIDVYRREAKAERDFLMFATYISYFPQLVAGPIERAKHIIPQLKNLNSPTPQYIREGLSLIVWGFFMKVAIADNASKIADVYLGSTASGLASAEVWLGVLAFTLQIYGDFAGYSSIARGLARLMGIDMMVNFNHPYFSMNPPEFWRRWHISLSRWLRDYLYISLGGNRGGPSKTLRNLMLTMILGGLWHGASMTFVLWGFYHGALLVVHRVWQARFGADALSGFFGRQFSRVLMFFCVLYGWLIFRSVDMHSLTLHTRRMFFENVRISEWLDFKINLFWFAFLALIVFFVDLWQELRSKEGVGDFRSIGQWLLAIFCLFAVLFFPGKEKVFLYFQF